MNIRDDVGHRGVDAWVHAIAGDGLAVGPAASGQLYHDGVVVARASDGIVGLLLPGRYSPDGRLVVGAEPDIGVCRVSLRDGWFQFNSLLSSVPVKAVPRLPPLSEPVLEVWSSSSTTTPRAVMVLMNAA